MASITSGWPPSFSARARTRATMASMRSSSRTWLCVLFDACGLGHVAAACHQQGHEHRRPAHRCGGARRTMVVQAWVSMAPGLVAHSKPSSTSSAARSRARALCSVSCHSISGTSSATTPRPLARTDVPSLIDGGANGNRPRPCRRIAGQPTGAAVQAALGAAPSWSISSIGMHFGRTA